jgi:hypothetical protein
MGFSLYTLYSADVVHPGLLAALKLLDSLFQAVQ